MEANIIMAGAGDAGCSVLKSFPEIKCGPGPKQMSLAEAIGEARLKQIHTEIKRLTKLHPDWKMDRLIRKAGEKYSVKFDFV